jgi:hypothetical protein
VVRGSRVTGGLLHIAQRDTGVQAGGDESVPQGVRSDTLVDPGVASDATHYASCSVSVETLTVAPEEECLIQHTKDLIVLWVRPPTA